MPRIMQETLNRKYGGSLEKYLENRRLNASKGGSKRTPKTKLRGFGGDPELASRAGRISKRRVTS